MKKAFANLWFTFVERWVWGRDERHYATRSIHTRCVGGLLLLANHLVFRFWWFDYHLANERTLCRNWDSRASGKSVRGVGTNIWFLRVRGLTWPRDCLWSMCTTTATCKLCVYYAFSSSGELIGWQWWWCPETITGQCVLLEPIRNLGRGQRQSEVPPFCQTQLVTDCRDCNHYTKLLLFVDWSFFNWWHWKWWIRQWTGNPRFNQFYWTRSVVGSWF